MKTRIDGGLGIQTLSCRIVDADKTTELWWPPLVAIEKSKVLSFVHGPASYYTKSEKPRLAFLLRRKSKVLENSFDHFFNVGIPRQGMLFFLIQFNSSNYNNGT